MSRTIILINTWTLPEDFLGSSGTAYFDEGKFEQFVDELAQVAGFARGVGATSASNVTPAVGPVSLTTHQDAADLAIPAGALVRVQSAAAAGKYMIGTVEAFAGTTLDLEVTIAAGAAATDWVISYAVPGAISSLSGDLDAAGNSITAILNATLTGLMSTLNMTATGLATLSRMRVGAGDEWAVVPLGSVITTQTVGPTTASVATVTLGADVALDHAAPAAGYEYSKKWRVTTGSPGGWIPSFRASDGTAAVWPNDDEPDWGALDTSDETRVVAVVEGASVVRMFRGG